MDIQAVNQSNIKASLEYERLIAEISAITELSLDEVKEFYEANDFGLEYIKEACLAGKKLTAEEMKEYNPFPFDFIGLQSDLDKLAKLLKREMTLKEKIVDRLEIIIYYTGYWLACPILWFVDWFWAGIKEAYEDIWE